MDNYKVKVILSNGLNDLKAGIFRPKDSIFNCSKERYEELSGNNAAKIVAVELIERPEEVIKEKVEKKTTNGSRKSRVK